MDDGFTVVARKTRRKFKSLTLAKEKDLAIFNIDNFQHKNIPKEIEVWLKERKSFLKLNLDEVKMKELDVRYSSLTRIEIPMDSWYKNSQLRAQIDRNKFNNCKGIIIQMEQYKNRIRTGSKITIKYTKIVHRRKQLRNIESYLVPIRGISGLGKRGIKGKKACISIPKWLYNDDIKAIKVNRFTENKHDLENFNDLCKKLNENPNKVLKNWLVKFILVSGTKLHQITPIQFQHDLESYLNLNKSQKIAVARAFGKYPLTLVQGPPGTGKTRTLAVIAKLLKNKHLKVLCLTRTNVAARRMVEAMIPLFSSTELGLKVSQEYYSWFSHLYTEEIKRNYKRFGYDAEVMVTTIGAVQGSIKDSELGPKVLKYSVLILDEASQIWDINAVHLFRYLSQIKRVIIFGDQNQLPPYVAEGVDNHKSIIDALLLKNVNSTMLNIQYRMPQELGNIISTTFYDDKLESFKKNDKKKHIIFVHVDGDAQVTKSGSTYNIEEAQKAHSLYMQELNRFGVSKKSPDESDEPLVVILSFYEAQRYEITLLGGDTAPAKVLNVDGFQGQEAPVIILSTATRGRVSGFLGDKRRVNVALSRAKEKVIILGCQKTLRTNLLWESILDQEEITLSTQ